MPINVSAGLPARAGSRKNDQLPLVAERKDHDEQNQGRQGAAPDGLDEKDVALLAALRDNAQASLHELAGSLRRRLPHTAGLSASALSNRRKRLEQDGYIRSYHALLDYEKLGWPMVVVIELRLQQAAFTKALDFSSIAEKIRTQLPEIEQMGWVVGDVDAMLLARVRDLKHLHELVFERLTEVCPGAISRTVVVSEVAFIKAGVGFEQVAVTSGEDVRHARATGQLT